MLCFAGQNVSREMGGKLVRRTGAEHARLNQDHGRISRAVELPVQASFCQRSCT